MPYNLLNEEWMMVLSAKGVRSTIAPWQITDAIDTDPILSLQTPRPDFHGALVQFLIGLLQTTFAPEDRDEWFRYFESPPAPETLREAFAPYAHAFELDGDKARFMQDQNPLAEQKPLPITALLIDTAGSETHFVKDLPTQGLSPAMAALALYTLQTNAPSGGAGHRTSLRGGGPLSTLVIATPEETGSQPSLWQTLWLNVLDEESFGVRATPEDAERIFPWLSQTRISGKGGSDTPPEAVHKLQMFWGMPRRIRLDVETVSQGTCAISGTVDDKLIRRYRTKNYGTNYTGAWHHTLSPYTDDGKQLLAMHPRGSISYRHWMGLVQEPKDSKVKRLPARVVHRFTADGYELDQEGVRFRLWAFGYDMDNMKPRCWFESTLPLFPFKDDEQQEEIRFAAERLVQAAGLFLENLRGRIKDAWFQPNDPRRKSAKLEHIQDAFWQETESDFYARIQALASAADPMDDRLAQFHAWHRVLRGYTETAFDRWVDYNQITEQSHPRRIAEARRNLRCFNYSKKIRACLELPDRSNAGERQAA